MDLATIEDQLVLQQQLDDLPENDPLAIDELPGTSMSWCWFSCCHCTLNP